MNYTSTRYDGPYGPNGGRGGPAVKSPQGVTRAGQPTHSASSSSSSIDGGHNMAGVGSHPSGNSSGGSYGSASQLQQHHYDSSGEYDHRFPGAARQPANGGPAMRAYAMQQQHNAQHQMGYPVHHRHAQLSDDYDGGSQYAAYNGQYPHRGDATPTYAQPSARMDRDLDREREQGEGDTSFDFLLSPGLAPVGPISTSSSLGQVPPALGLPPSQSQANLPPPLVHSNSFLPQSVTPSRPTFNRSQTAMPAPSGSGRAFQPPSNYSHQQQPIYAADHSSSSGLGASAGPPAISAANQQGQQGSRDYAPPPAISAQALLDIVLSMRADQPTSGQPQAGPSSSSAMMSRSQSANAAARLQQVNQIPAHMRNTSTGSTKSDDDPIMQGNQLSGALQVPSHPGMARTASSRNLNDNQAALRTIDLTHHRIGDVPVEVIDALEGTVGRLALGYNYITTLSPSFARLGNTLRYLNIRLNMLTTFPAVLCEMPSLEILDISRNKIKRLPAQCGSLKGLRVFSISKNRVKRLPTYFADMKQLRVLKIDHNPLEWPPREITTQPPSTSSADGQSKRENDAAQSKLEAQALQKWLIGLQDWIRDHANEPNAPPSMSLRQDEGSDLAAPRGRPEPAHSQSDSHLIRVDREEVTSVPPDPPASANSIVSPVQSSVTGSMSPRDLPTIETDASRLSQHGRSESHSLAGGGAPRKPLLRSKKSLPDLRQNHAQILDERFHDDATPSTRESSQAGMAGAKAQTKHRKTPSTASPGMSPVSARPSEALPSLPNSASGERRYPIPGIMHGRSGSEEVDGLAPLPSALDNALSRGRRNVNGQLNNHPHQNGGERGTSGAYFKRLSMLPASTISKAVPSALLRFIEGIRGIFFSLSQMHASLKQCIVSPATDRLPTVFTKMMASADDAMGFLIDALDKFDSTTRRGMPDTAIVKDVVETCRENLTIFGKLVTIILNQSKNLFNPNSDVRYMRALVLGLFGAIGEIEISWNALDPLREDIVRWLKGETDLSPTSLQLQPPTPSPQEGTFPPFHAQPGQASPIPQRSQASPGLSSAGTPLAPGRVPLARTRRHAGSFSKYPQYPA